MAAKVRLDRLLVERGLAPSRERAQAWIAAGRVRVDGVPAEKAATQVPVDRPITVDSGEHVWVGRGAIKLLGALDALHVDPSGRVCADLGASTGGFTEVLLHRGAQRVYAVDVGREQLHSRLRQDPRVVVMEGVNARHLASLPEPIALLVGDLSFISLALILPTVLRLLVGDGEAVILVKPQFEAGRAAIARGGRVRSEAERSQAITAVTDEATRLGFTVLGGVDCALPGARAGNIEWFLHLRKPASHGVC